MEVLFLKTPKDIEKIGEFNEYWGITRLCSVEDNTFLYKNKKYKFARQYCEPTVVMKCIDDNSEFTFGVSSDLKDEFELI